MRLFFDLFNRRNIVVNLAVCADDDRSAAAGISLAPKLKVKVRIEQQLILVSVWGFVHINVRSATSVLNCSERFCYKSDAFIYLFIIGLLSLNVTFTK